MCSCSCVLFTSLLLVLTLVTDLNGVFGNIQNKQGPVSVEYGTQHFPAKYDLVLYGTVDNTTLRRSQSSDSSLSDPNLTAP